MKFEIGAMSVGDILDRGLKIFTARLPTFYAINLLVLSPVILFQIATPAVLFGAESGPASPEVLLGFLCATMGVLLLILILVPIGQAATLYVIGQEFIDERVGVGAALQFALKRWLPLLGASIVVGLAVGVGMVLCLIPGFIFWTWFAFAAQVVVMEGLGPIDAMNRSKDLGSNSFGRVLGLLLLMFAILLVVWFINNILNQVFQPLEVVPTSSGPRIVLRSYGLYVTAQIVNFLLSVAAQSYMAICVTLMYFDLRIRKEGFDLELAARQHSRKHDEFGEPTDEEPESRFTEDPGHRRDPGLPGAEGDEPEGRFTEDPGQP